MMAHAYHPNYSGGLQFEASLGKKLVKPHLNKQVGDDVHTAVIPATREA
jgi:hypothetical protein